MGFQLPGWLKAILEGGYEPQADEDKLYALADQYDACAAYLTGELSAAIQAAGNGFGAAYHGEAGSALSEYLRRYATDANACGPVAMADDVKHVAEFLRTMGDTILRTKRELLIIGIVSWITILAGLGPVMGTLIRKLGQEGVKRLLLQLLKKLVNREAKKLQARMVGEMVANAAQQTSKFVFSRQMVPKVLGLVGAEVADEVIPHTLAGWWGEVTGHDRRLVVDGNGRPVKDADGNFVTTHDWDWRGTAMTTVGAVVGVPLSHGVGAGLAKVPGLGKIGRTFVNNAITSPLSSSLTALGFGEGWHNPTLQEAWLAGAHGAVRNSTPSDVHGPLESIGEKAGEYIGNKIISAVPGGHPPGGGPDGGGQLQSPPAGQTTPANGAQDLGQAASQNTAQNATQSTTQQTLAPVGAGLGQTTTSTTTAGRPAQPSTSSATSTQQSRADQETAVRRNPATQPSDNGPNDTTDEQLTTPADQTAQAEQADQTEQADATAQAQAGQADATTQAQAGHADATSQGQTAQPNATAQAQAGQADATTQAQAGHADATPQGQTAQPNATPQAQITQGDATSRARTAVADATAQASPRDPGAHGSSTPQAVSGTPDTKQATASSHQEASHPTAQTLDERVLSGSPAGTVSATPVIRRGAPTLDPAGRPRRSRPGEVFAGTRRGGSHPHLPGGSSRVSVADDNHFLYGDRRVTPHELASLARSANHEIVTAALTPAATALAQKLADITGQDVVLRSSDDTQVLTPADDPALRPDGVVVLEDGKLIRKPRANSAYGIELEITEDNLGTRLGAGRSKTAFAFYDKVVLVAHPGVSLAAEVAQTNHLRSLPGGEHVIAPIHRVTTLFGRDAIVVDRYATTSHEVLDEEAPDPDSRMPGLPTQATLESLQALHAYAIENHVLPGDLQFAITHDGRFHAYDIAGTRQITGPDDPALTTLNTWLTWAASQLTAPTTPATLAPGTPVPGTPVSGTPVSGTPGSGTPAPGTSVSGDPASGGSSAKKVPPRIIRRSKAAEAEGEGRARRRRPEEVRPADGARPADEARGADGARRAGGMRVGEVREVVDGVLRRMRLPRGLPVKVVVGANNGVLVEEYGIEPAAGPRPAYFRLENGTGVVYLSAYDHLSAEDVAASVWHEVVGHFGWRLFSPETRSEVLTAVHELRGLDPELSAEIDELYPDQPVEVRDEEFLAALAEDGVPGRLRQAWNHLLSTRLGDAFLRIGAISNETLERARRDHHLEPLHTILRSLVRAIRRGRPVHDSLVAPRSRTSRPGPNISRIRPAQQNRYDGGGLPAFTSGVVESSYDDLLDGSLDERALAAALPGAPGSKVKRFLVSDADERHFVIEGARLTPHHLAVMTDLYRNVSLVLDTRTPQAADLAQQLADIMGVDIVVRTPDGWQSLRPRTMPHQEGTVEFGPGDTLILRTPDNPDGVPIDDLEPHLGRLLGVGGSKAAFAFYDKVVLIALPTIEVSFFKQLRRTLDLLTKPGAAEVVAPVRYTTVFERDAFVADRFPTISRDIWASIPDFHGSQVLRPTQATLDSLLAIRAFFVANNLVITDLQFGIDPDGRFWAYDVGRVRPLPSATPPAVPGGVNLAVFSRAGSNPLEVVDAWIAWAADGLGAERIFTPPAAVRGAPPLNENLEPPSYDWATATRLTPDELPAPPDGVGIRRTADQLVKLYPDTPEARDRAVAELKRAHLAARTGYGPAPRGLVTAELDGTQYVGFATDAVEGGSITTPSGVPGARAEDARWRRVVTLDTVLQLHDYGRRLVALGHQPPADLRGFVDERGIFRPVEFAEAVPGGRLLGDELLAAAIENVKRAAGNRDSGRARRVSGPRGDDAVAEVFEHVPSYRRLTLEEQRRMVTVVEAVTGNDAVLLDGLRPVLTSPGFRALGPDALKAEIDSWVGLEYADVFSKGVEFDAQVTGAPQVPDALTTRPADWAEATDLGDLPSSLPRMSSAGEAGSVARLGPHSGAYLIERPDGSEWVVKLRPDGSGFRAQAIAEYEGLLGAAATGYGPTPYGLVRATIAGQDYAGVAMAQAPGGFIGTSAVDPAETEQWRAAVTFDTVRQYDQYLQRLLDAGYYVRTDLQVFVDGDGNLRPIDFEFVAALPAEPAARRTAIESHGTGSFIGRAVRRQLLDAAVANARRHQGDRSLLAATDAVVEDGLPLQERETIAREAFARLKLPKHVLDRIELVTPPTQDAFYQRYRQVERITELRRGHFQPNPDGSAELVIILDANPTRAAILETVLHEAAHLVFAASSPVEQLQLQNDIDRIPGTPLVRQWRQEITELYAGASRHLVNEELLARAYAHIVEEFGDVPSAVRTWLDGVVTGTFGRICVRLGLVSPETLRDARTRRDHDLAPFYRVLRTALQGRQRAIHPANYHQTRASLGSEQSDSFAQAVRRSGGALQVVVDVRDAPATDTAHPTLEGARVQRQLAAAQQRLDQAIAAWNLALEQGALPDAALEKALDEAADVFVLRRDEAGRQLGRDAVLAAIRQLETTVTEDHRAFVVLTREDGSSRRLVLHNDGNRPRYVDSDQQDVERSAVLRGARSDVVSVEALVLDPAGTPVPFAGRPIGTHNEYGAETPVSPDELLHLPADQHAAVLARIERGAAMRAPADDSLVRFWSDAPALPDAIENVAAIEPVGPGWLRVTTRGGLTLLAGVRRGPVAHGEVTVERVGDTAAFVITVAQGIDRELADLTFGQLIDAELDADWVEAAAAGHIAALAAQLDIVAPVRARLQAADEAFALPPADVSLVDWSTVREALTDIRAGLDDPYQPANLALAADRLRTAHTHVPAPGALHELATGASQAAAQLGGSGALRRGYDVPDWMTPADVLTATKLQVRHRRLNAGTPDQLGRYDARRLNRRRRARLREAVSAAGLDIGAVNHFDRFRLLDRSGYGKVVELALEYGARPGLVASLPLTVDTGWLDETLRRPRFQQAVGATLVPTEKAGVVTVSVKGHDPFTLAVRLDGQEQPSADPVADVVVPFEADREADPSVHELAGRVAKAITSHLSPADRESADLLTWQALGGQAGHELGLNDQAAVGWLRSFSLHHAEPTWRDARALREFLYQKGLLPNSPDYEHKFAALQRVDGELADYVLRHNGARRVTRVRRLIETRPLGEAGIEPSRAAIPVFDGSDLVRLASWLTRFEEGPHGRRLSFARSGENTVAITVPRTDGSPDVVTVVVEPAAGLAARHGQVVRGAEASTYHLRTPPGVDRLRGERLTIEGLYAVVAEHLDSTTALPPGIAAVLARFEQQLVSAAGWRTFRMLVKDLTEHLAELGLDDHALTELDDLIPSSLRRVLTRKGRARSAQAMAEQLEERLDRGEAEPSRVPRRAIFLGGMALDKLLIGVGNAALGLALFHNSSWLGATFAIGYGLAEGCGQGYLMYRGQLAGEKLEQAVRGRGAALRAERGTAQAALLRDDVRDVIRPLLENVVRVPSAEPARPTPTARRWSAYDSEPWVLQRSQRYHLWSNLPYGVMSTIEPVALVGAGAGQWALAAVFGVTAGLGYVGASFGERRRTRHDVANRLRQGQFDDVRRIHARRQEEALRAHNLQLGISALIREAGQTPPAAATTLLARRVSDDQLGRPVFDRRPNRGLDIGQVLDVRYPTILAPGAVGTAIGLFVSPVVAAVQAGNTIVNTWINAMVESGYGDLDTHYTDLTSAQLAHASLVRSRQSDDRLLGGVHDLVWSALAGPGDTRPAVPGEVVADLVVAEPQAPIMPPFWRKIFPLTALLPGIGEFAAVSTLGSTVAAATGAGETAKDEVTTGSVNAVLTSITGTAGHYPLNWFRAGKQALQGYHRMAEGAIAEGKTKQRALRAVLDDDQHGNAAALGQLFTTEGRTVDNSAAVAEMTAGLFADGRTRALLELLTKLDGVEVDPADPLRVRVERDGRSRQLRFVVGDVENHAPAKWEADEDSVTVTVSRLLGDAVEVFPAVGHELREIGELLVGTPADGAHERGQETQLAVLGWVADQESDPKAGVRADLALLDTVTSLGLMPGTETERFALLEPELIPLIDRVASRVDVLEQDVAAVSLAPDAARPLRIAHNSWESALQGLGAQVGGLGSVVKALLPAQVGLGHYALNVTRQLFGFGAAGLTELISQGRGLQVMLIPPPDGYRTEDHLKADEVGWSDAMSDRTLAAWEEYLAAHPDQLPDVLHAHDGWMTRSAFDLADAYGVPVVLTVHATEIGRRGGRLDTDTSRSIHALEWRTVRRADHVIVNSPKMKEEAVAAFHLSPDRVTIIPNGTDPSRWKIDRATVDRDSARARLQAGPQDTVIYYQGRLAKEKGVQDLIAALPAVQRRYPDAKLRVVGDDTGEFAAALKQQVSALVTEGRLAAGDVVFLGRIGHAEGLPELVASADVGVIPSRYEPFGVVANELATAGLPLVASDQIGFVDQSNGLAYPAGAVDELVTAILGVLDDPAGAGRRAEAAREKALSPMYHWEVIAQQTVDVYRGIEAHQVRSPEEIGEVVYPGSGDGGHWYQSAVFYQALVRAYRDGDGDGYGDLRGLIEQLDYIELLGVDCLWLNPIYPSPLKDGGYDVSDYTDVHPSAGTLDDFKELLAEAHRRGIRIIVDFVPNHSSDQHPWFQESRRDPDGPYGDFYVWSDTPERFYTPLHTDPDGGEYIVDPDTGERRAIDPESTWLRITSASGQPLIGPRIIFTDTETSNWTWDPVRGQYFWHRFFGHQPDLNFENPAVQQAILDAQEFWLDLGVDGFRVDAVPYLYVREGTNGENLPETHAFVRRMRALADRYDAMVLCEANQPLDDLMAYFGDPAKGGDGFQMAFDFALMPRLYMALASEVAEPIRELVRHRPALPASAALMTFLDNHDERTTEMVSNAEREYLHATYDPTHQRKSNDGFVGRLAPLLGNDPARIKLANGLLFALSGSPIIYYGDELGMGDNPALPDRDAQRTPMPWRPDRNAGFSVAAPYRPSNGDPDPRHLYLPPVTGSPDGFREVNVEHQLYDESSLLYWTRDLIGAYKQHPVLAVGTFTDLAGSNGHVLAFARQDGDEVVLGIFNLAGTTQATDLDLSAWAGRRPTDILGQQRFRVIDDLPYAVTLDGNGFYWLTLNRRVPE